MPELTRRRSLESPDECWHVYYGDVYVGTIALRTGMPPGEDPWDWNCGFYPGGHPGECTDGTAATFKRARADFEKAWRVFLREFWFLRLTGISARQSSGCTTLTAQFTDH
jgi:hypothetical protein